MRSLLHEVWVWISRATDGRPHSHIAEALHESSALARRLGIPLVAVSDRLLLADETAMLARWSVSGLRMLDAVQPPHPRIVRGMSPLAGLNATPRAFVLLADVFGAVVAPLFSAETGAELVTLATSVTCDSHQYVVSRPTLGGQYEALVSVPREQPLVVTLQPGSVGEAAPAIAQEPMALEIPLLGSNRAAALQGEHPPILAPQADTLAVSDADRIVAFGRGAFSRESIALVESLANLLGATIAGTRPAADEGWLPFAKQVGLTGAIVSPKLYVAVGISGAPYHMVGIKDPETLIAINSDPEAPIFATANLGIVGDLRVVLPALIARLQAGLAMPEAVNSLRSTRAS